LENFSVSLRVLTSPMMRSSFLGEAILSITLSLPYADDLAGDPPVVLFVLDPKER
jgi:hypothetical protein